MKSLIAFLTLTLCLLAIAAATPVQETTKTVTFDSDPVWEGINNRPTSAKRVITQDFGYSRTSHAGGQTGEVGGLITPCAEPAYYARRISKRTLAERLEASGKFIGQGRE